MAPEERRTSDRTTVVAPVFVTGGGLGAASLVDVGPTGALLRFKRPGTADRLTGVSRLQLTTTRGALDGRIVRKEFDHQFDLYVGLAWSGDAHPDHLDALTRDRVTVELVNAGSSGAPAEPEPRPSRLGRLLRALRRRL